MARFNGTKHRMRADPRHTLVKGDTCPGMYVEDPRITLVRNIHRLVDRLAQKGMTQADFIRLSGVSRTAWQSLYRGATWPDPGTLQKIASAAGVPVEVLFRR